MLRRSNIQQTRLFGKACGSLPRIGRRWCKMEFTRSSSQRPDRLEPLKSQRVLCAAKTSSFYAAAVACRPDPRAWKQLAAISTLIRPASTRCIGTERRNGGRVRAFAQFTHATVSWLKSAFSLNVLFKLVLLLSVISV